MKGFVRRFVAAIVGLTLVFSVAAFPRKAYLRDLKESTRELVIYSGFETALILRGTYLSEEFRRSMSDQRAHLLGTPPEDNAAWIKRSLEDAATYWEIVFSADSELPSGEDFGTTDDGWIVRLEADGVVQPMVTMYLVREPNPLQRALYPHISIYADFWVARFERKTAHPSEIALFVGSGYGHGDIRWNLRGEGAR